MSLLLVAALLTGPTAPAGPCADQDWNGGTRDMRRAIGCVWDRFDMSDRAKAVSVAECESGLNPTASNGGRFVGLFQQMASAWSGRSARYGYAGRAITDPVANVNVSMGMVRDDGDWGQWSCSP